MPEISRAGPLDAFGRSPEARTGVRRRSGECSAGAAEISFGDEAQHDLVEEWDIDDDFHTALFLRPAVILTSWPTDCPLGFLRGTVPDQPINASY